jgi:DNA-binding transcriptional LysR family regulator
VDEEVARTTIAQLNILFIDREFRAHHRPMPRGLIETGSILTTINLVTRSELLGVIPESVARRDAKHGVFRVLPYRFRQQLESYGSLVPKDRPLTKPAVRFLDLLHLKRLPR